jgi:putative ABC transport system substrate-binding protein
MRRRELIGLLGGAAVVWPVPANAQQPLPVVGFLGAVSAEGFSDRTRAYREGLGEAGYTEGVNVLIDYQWAENQLDRLPALAADLVRKKVAVITAHGGTAPAIAAKAATRTIPIVFTTPEDPVASGLVSSLSHPGGNLTGVNLFIGELMSKRLELLRAMLPRMARIAVLVNPANPARAEAQVKEAESAAAAMGVKVRVFQAGTVQQINAAFATFATEPPDALFVSPDPYYVVRRVQLATLAARHAISTSFSVRDFAEAGGLMSYGTNIVDSYRQAGVYTGRVLKGAKPADLPVVQSSKVELAINIQSARMLGLTVPNSLLAIADEVIE